MAFQDKNNPFSTVVLFYHDAVCKKTPFFFYKIDELLRQSIVDETIRAAMSSKRLTNTLRLATFDAVDTTGTWSASVFAKVENGKKKL